MTASCIDMGMTDVGRLLGLGLCLLLTVVCLEMVQQVQ